MLTEWWITCAPEQNKILDEKYQVDRGVRALTVRMPEYTISMISPISFILHQCWFHCADSSYQYRTVVAHDRVGTEVDAEDRGEGFEFIDDPPLTAMCVILTGELINAAQKGATHAAGLHTVVVRSISEIDLVDARFGHGRKSAP